MRKIKNYERNHFLRTRLENLKKWYLVKVKITGAAWHYNVGDEILIPVLAGSPLKAHLAISDNYWGSEYPCYSIESVSKLDTGLFKPFYFEGKPLDVDLVYKDSDFTKPNKKGIVYRK